MQAHISTNVNTVEQTTLEKHVPNWNGACLPSMSYLWTPYGHSYSNGNWINTFAKQFIHNILSIGYFRPKFVHLDNLATAYQKPIVIDIPSIKNVR